MRPQGIAQQLQKRRERASELFKAGKQPAAMDRALSALRSSVSRWCATFKREGVAVLRPQPISGQPTALSTQHQQRLVKLLFKGARVAG